MFLGRGVTPSPVINVSIAQCDLNFLCLPLSVLQEIEKIRQQSTHEGVHKDGPE